MNTLATGAAGSLLHELAAVPRAEWIVALIAATVAAVAYELVVKVVVRRITASLPFVLLRLTRLMLRRDAWRVLFHEIWAPDLHDTLDTDEGTAAGRYLAAMRFSLSLLLGGAVRAARQLPGPARRAPSARVHRVIRVLRADLRSAGLSMSSVATLAFTVVRLGSDSPNVEKALTITGWLLSVGVPGLRRLDRMRRSRRQPAAKD
ncbi:hypothetical protein OG401_40325 [Kitasatospora purpeofusca]|uniref:hypothetical protein n=1 Tax=Kitasatospora purpeofusca TaxID=67352 RepID=UPI00225364C5|nr:hypothetical protein [Kitasatospora purpeofusca]MCX4690471.1 hypothetical protein [Kitasatospora purpeofusca]